MYIYESTYAQTTSVNQPHQGKQEMLLSANYSQIDKTLDNIY